jgi:biopolymer transport protein TolR
MGMDVGGDKGNVRSDINVTPLVDVCLVLLIIFMVVTPMLQKGQGVQMAETENPAKKPESSNQVMIVVAVGTPPIYYLDEKQYSRDQFAQQLNEKYQRAPNTDLVIKADRRLTWGDVKQVMQITKDAGFEDVGLIVEKKPQGAS